MKYDDKLITMEGIIVEVHDGCVGIDLKGRLGYLKIPLRMLITDYEIKVGQEVGFRMSFIEQLGSEPNNKYISNQTSYKKRQEEIRTAHENREEKTK